MSYHLFSATCTFSGCTRVRAHAGSGLCGGHERIRLKGEELRPLDPSKGRPTNKSKREQDADAWIAQLRARKVAPTPPTSLRGQPGRPKAGS